MNLDSIGVLFRSGPRNLLRVVRRKLLSPPVGAVDFGDLRTLEPVSRLFGFDRGTPIDRYYIEQFLERNSGLVTGACLEIADAEYTLRFGRNVTRSDILYVDDSLPTANVVGDLTDLRTVRDNTYDCLIATQTLQFIYEIRTAIAEIHRVLSPGGSCLCTISACAQISRYDMDRWGEYWRMTSIAARRLFEESFDGENIEVQAYGNVLAAVAGFHGLTAEELSPRELDFQDPDYELVVTIRATKARNL